MNWLATIPQAAAMILAARLAVHAWRHRDLPGAPAFALMMAAVSAWTATDPAQAIFGAHIVWMQIGLIAAASVPPLWLVFALRYTGVCARTSPITAVLLSIVPLGTATFALATPASHMLWRSVAWIGADTGPSLADCGPWFWVHAAYSYIACLFGVLLFVVMSLHKSRIYRRQASVGIISAALPLTANLLRVFEVVKYDATAIGFALSGVILAFGLLRLGVFDVLPVARDAVVDNIQECVIVLDHARRIVDANPVAERTFGLGTFRAIGRPLAEVFAQWPDLVSHCSMNQAADIDISLKLDNAARDYSLTTVPLTSRHGDATGLLVILHDITELRESYRKLQELGRLKEDLTNMIVHDLRTPMVSIASGLAAIERMGGLDEGQREMLSMAINSGQGLLRMINDLLDISRMESEPVGLEITDLAIEELTEAIRRQVTPLAAERQQTLDCRVAPGVRAIRADAGMLHRALVNLLDNAIKFTPAGGCVTLDVRPRPDDNCILFSVSDTGEGIPRDAFERIFEKFGQVTTRRSGRKMSTGLGLTLCKMVAEAHGGRVWVESEVGQGSTFSLTIPLTQPHGQ